MSPTQQRVELDQDRKEELILAKQLRACRVQILPRNNDNCYQLRSSVSPLPTPTSPRSPRPGERDVMEELNMKMTRISGVKERGRTPPVQPSSPVILINGERKERSPVRLPFLNEIKQLPRAEPHTPSAVFSPGPALSQPEPRPTQNSFPFLDDIRKLRKDSTQTNRLEREDRQNTFSQTQTQNIHYGRDGHPESQNIFNKESNGLEMPAVSSKEIGGAKVKFQNDLLKFNKDSSLSVSPPSKTVRFSGEEGSRVEAEKVSKQVEVDESDDSDLRLGRTQRGKKCSSKLSVKIDDKTNVSKLADNIIPQLNNMQKNFLGLLFFNELSQTIVDDIVAQQVSMMSGSKLSSVLSGLRPEAGCTAVNLLLNTCPDESKLSVLCDHFSYLSSEEKAGILFTTSDDVVDICTTIADYGGRNFKRSLISKLIAGEDDQFLSSLQERPGRRKVSARGEDGARTLSSTDEIYNSAEESLADDAYQYQYFDFENK